MDADVFAQLMKSISAKLCPNVTGQAAMDVVVNPPTSDEPSHKVFIKVCTLKILPSPLFLSRLKSSILAVDLLGFT